LTGVLLRRWRFAAPLAAAWLLVVLAGLQPVPARAGDGMDWIAKISSAMRNLNYVGSFVYIHGGDVESMRIYHSRIDSTEYERLISLNGEAREIIRDADSVTCVWPGSKSVIVASSEPRTPFPRLEAAQLDTLRRHYKVIASGTSRVAGRLAKVIEIVPADDFRYGYRFWIDRETDMLLRSIMMNERGEIIEQVMFTDIEYPDLVPVSMFRPTTIGTEYRWEKADPVPPQPVPVDFPKLVADSIPAGFEAVSEVMVPVSGGGSTARRTQYTDGLATVSVFVAKPSDNSGDWALLGPSSMAGVNAFGAMVGSIHVTVVGEVPMATVQTIADSLKLAELSD